MSPGIVAAVPVREGQRVKKGDVLLRLDPRQFQIALDGAKANLAGIGSDLNARSSTISGCCVRSRSSSPRSRPTRPISTAMPTW